MGAGKLLTEAELAKISTLKDMSNRQIVNAAGTLLNACSGIVNICFEC